MTHRPEHDAYAPTLQMAFKKFAVGATHTSQPSRRDDFSPGSHTPDAKRRNPPCSTAWHCWSPLLMVPSRPWRRWRRTPTFEDVYTCHMFERNSEDWDTFRLGRCVSAS